MSDPKSLHEAATNLLKFDCAELTSECAANPEGAADQLNLLATGIASGDLVPREQVDALGLRPEVLAWAQLMEARMRVGDERGWTMDGVTAESLVGRAIGNLADAESATDLEDHEKALECYVDAANLSMLAALLLSRQNAFTTPLWDTGIEKLTIIRPTCPTCGGSGIVPGNGQHPDAPGAEEQYITCPKCHGTGSVTP